VGNIYTGPHPTTASASVGATSAAQPATSVDQPTTTPFATSATQQTAESTTSRLPTSSINTVQHPSTSSKVTTGNGGATGTSASVVATQSSALLLKSGGFSIRPSRKDCS
jgi:hypothetical protein